MTPRSVPLVLLAVLVVGCGGGVQSVPVGDARLAVADRLPAPPAATDPPSRPLDRVGIGAILDEAAAAFAAGDPDRLRPLLLDPGTEFGRAWLARAHNLAGAPLSHYRLRLNVDFPDLATDVVDARYGGDAVVVAVLEEHAYEGFDASGPAREDLYLTLVETDRGWRFAGDRDAEPLGLTSADHLWDHGAVASSGTGPILIVHHPDDDAVPALLDDAERALRSVSQRWPLEWPGRVVLLVPGTQDELAALLKVTFDVSNFTAFATSSRSGDGPDFRLTGVRVLVNPHRLLTRSAATRHRILAHEFLHAATRSVTGPLMPTWLEEGVAQAMGEDASTTGTRLLDALAAAGFDGSLPRDGSFTSGSRDEIFRSYQLAWSFLEHLETTRGPGPVAAFYVAAGAGAIGEPGTRDWHLDRAAREAFGLPLAALTDEWRRALG